MKYSTIGSEEKIKTCMFLSSTNESIEKLAATIMRYGDSPESCSLTIRKGAIYDTRVNTNPDSRGREMWTL